MASRGHGPVLLLVLLLLLLLPLLPLLPLLLVAPKRARRRMTLVLDLDETLVHTRFGEGGEAQTLVRPHAREFLARARAEFSELVVFTASVRSYADRVLDELDPGALIARRLYRDSCTPIESPDTGAVMGFAKDLRRVAAEADVLAGRVLLLDNTPAAYSLQPWCGVPIRSWYGDPGDGALLETLAALAHVARAAAPREVLAEAVARGWLPVERP